VPPHARHQVRLDVEVEGICATIVERRAPWRADWTRLPIAGLRYSPTHAAWMLFWRDRNLDPLLAEIDADPTAIFWG
jgi:hypothetical protein